MKNFKYILVLLVFITNVVWAQNPNNHWQLGNSDVNFSTNPPTVSTSGVSTQYGNASISDDNGNLLFYTDGKTVWNKNHQVMTNGNFYPDLGDNKNCLIVPNPSNTNQYYIFRSQIYTTLGSTWNSFYNYSLVEFSNSSPLGALIYINPNPNFQENNFTKKLQEANGNYIENKFNFSPLTIAKNNSADGYWIITQSKNKILSYSINTLGFNTIPVESIFTNPQIYDHGVNYANIGFNIIGKTHSDYKISPSNDKLGGITYFERGGESSNNYTSRFYTLNFNATTGQLNNFIDIYNEDNISYGYIINNFEFSNNSENVYFTRFNDDFINNYPDFNPEGEIVVKSLTSLTSPPRKLYEFNNSTFFPQNFNYLQRDKYGNILISSTYSNLNRNLYLHKINNQDSYSNSSIILNSISLNSNTISKLPQLIPVLSPPCPSALVLSTNVTSGVDKKQASVSIEASNTVNNGFGAIYHAPVVLLKHNFNAKAGSTAHLYPIGCTGTFIARQSQTESNIESEESEIKVKSKVINVSPNPNNGIFKITINDIVDGTIVVTDLYGFTVFKSEIKNQKEFEMNLQSNPKGIYVVKIISGDTTYTEKVIKN